MTLSMLRKVNLTIVILLFIIDSRIMSHILGVTRYGAEWRSGSVLGP